MPESNLVAVLDAPTLTNASPVHESSPSICLRESFGNQQSAPEIPTLPYTFYFTILTKLPSEAMHLAEGADQGAGRPGAPRAPPKQVKVFVAACKVLVESGCSGMHGAGFLTLLAMAAKS